MILLLAFCGFIIGLILGSFLNVCIYRIPRGESIVLPPSHCPSCKAKITWYQNIPLLSYIFLRGKCSSCAKPISLVYPLVELATGLLFGGTILAQGVGTNSFFILIGICFLVYGAATDFRGLYIPNTVSVSIMILALLRVIYTPLTFDSFIIGGATLGLPFLLIYGYVSDIYKKEVLGFGDVKLAVALGMFSGYRGLHLIHIFLAYTFVFGALFGICLLFTRRLSKNHELPLGPFIALGWFFTYVLS